MSDYNNRRSSTQRKYRTEVVKGKDDSVALENEIRVKRDGAAGGYINRAAELLLRTENPYRNITISAIGQAIPIALAVSEKIREKIAGLHAIQSIQTIQQEIVYKPYEQGLDEINQVRYSAAFRIILTLDATPEDKKHPGYSAPRENVVTATLDEIKTFKQQRARTGNSYNGNRSNQGIQQRINQGQGGRPYNNDSRGGQSRGGYNNSNRDGRSGQSRRRGAPRQEKRYDGPSQNRI